MSASKVLFYLCISFIAGIFLQSIFKIPQYALWGFLFSGIIFTCTSFLKNKNFYLIFGFCFLIFAIGILRTQISQFQITQDPLIKFLGKNIVVTGVVYCEPDIKDNYQNIKVNMQGGKIIVLAQKYPKINYLDQVKLTGKLQDPADSGGQSYKNYLAKDGINSVMSFPKTEVLSRKHDYGLIAFLYEKVLFLKQSLRQSIERNFSGDYGAVLRGTILGDNSAMSDSLKNNLNATGLRHIIAVSGTHVVILSAIIMSLFILIGFWRGQAFYFTTIIIWIYVLITGLPSSGIRAGIMGSLFLLAQKAGRQGSAERLVVLAGAIMLSFNPLLLFFDAGFQLSFVAVLGLIYIDPLIKRFVKFSALSQTISAQIATLPIMVFGFGNISLVAPLTNFIVAIVVEPLMVFGFISAFLGMFSNILGWIFSVPCYVLLFYFIWVINFFSGKFAMIKIENISVVWLFLFYLILGAATYFLQKKIKNDLE